MGFSTFERLLRRCALGLGFALLLASCGGGGGDDPVQCRVDERKAWLRSYFAGNYFWGLVTPQPDPAAYSTWEAYFEALRYPGGIDPAFPAKDKWSSYEPTVDVTNGLQRNLVVGYGLAVAGGEVNGQSGKPLYVRYVAPNSPAARAGLIRTDEILSINGRSASDIIADPADIDVKYAILTPKARGDVLTVEVRSLQGTVRTLALTAAEFTQQSVVGTQVLASTGGRRLGYVFVREMNAGVTNELVEAFAQLKTQNVVDLVLDLRYNGGGLVDVGRDVASYVSGGATGKTGTSTYVAIKHRADQTSRDKTVPFVRPANALSMNRVFVLTGGRTASAAEQVISGLKPYVNVVMVGSKTYGKPVGSVVVADGCGTSVLAINFESVNKNGEGRYFNGLGVGPTDVLCTVSEDFTKPLGDRTEPLLAAAMTMADGGGCPASVSTFSVEASSTPRLEGVRPAMVP